MLIKLGVQTGHWWFMVSLSMKMARRCPNRLGTLSIQMSS